MVDTTTVLMDNPLEGLSLEPATLLDLRSENAIFHQIDPILSEPLSNRCGEALFTALHALRRHMPERQPAQQRLGLRATETGIRGDAHGQFHHIEIQKRTARLDAHA